MARLLASLVGHRETLEPLLEAAAHDRLAATLLFAGPSGIGKRQAAMALAQALICERPQTVEVNSRTRIEPCGECASCLRVEKGQSESLLQVEPDGAQIKIEQAREILQFLHLRKSGRSRVILIDQAHLMNPQTANSLLKSLEEPPHGTYFILVTPLAASLLATIRSRSQLVRFRPLSDGDLRRILGPTVDDWTVRSAVGSVEVAKRLLESREDFIQAEDAAAQYLAIGFARMPTDEITKLKDIMRDRTSQTFVASAIQGVLRDVLRVQAGLKQAPGERFPEIVEAISKLPQDCVRDLAELSLEFEQDLGRNVDKGLILENFAIHWRKAAEQTTA